MKAQEPVSLAMGQRQDSWPASETLQLEGKTLDKITTVAPSQDGQGDSVESSQATAPDTPTSAKDEAAITEATTVDETKPEEPAAEEAAQTVELSPEEKIAAATARTANMVKKIDLVANIIEQELDELSEEQLENLAPNLRRQIEILRKMAEESKKDATTE
jgi:nitric oxide reductase activation protein